MPLQEYNNGLLSVDDYNQQNTHLDNPPLIDPSAESNNSLFGFNNSTKPYDHEQNNLPPGPYACQSYSDDSPYSGAYDDMCMGRGIGQLTEQFTDYNNRLGSSLPMTGHSLALPPYETTMYDYDYTDMNHTPYPSSPSYQTPKTQTSSKKSSKSKKGILSKLKFTFN